MHGKIFGNHGSKFWNFDLIQLRTLVIKHILHATILIWIIQIWRVKIFPMLRAEQMNLKPPINLSLHAGSAGDVLDAISTGDTRVFFPVGGISDKSLFEINSKIKVSSSWMLIRMGSTPACSIDEMQSTMFVNGMSIEKCAATGDALFSQGVLSQPDSRLMTSQIAGPKIYPRLKPRDGWWKIIVLFQNSHHCLLFQTLVWNWPHALRLLAVTQHDVDESPIHAQLIVSAGSLMVHACTNNFPLTSGEVSNYYINWSKASFDFSIADIQEQNNVLHICWLCCKIPVKNYDDMQKNTLL